MAVLLLGHNLHKGNEYQLISRKLDDILQGKGRVFKLCASIFILIPLIIHLQFASLYSFHFRILFFFFSEETIL